MGFWSDIYHGLVDVGKDIHDKYSDPFTFDGAMAILTGGGAPAIEFSIEGTKDNWSVLKHHLIPDMRRDRELMVSSSVTSRKLIYGRTRVGGQLAYFESSGADSTELHVLMIFAGHAIDAYEEIWLDDKLAATVSGGVITMLAPYQTNTVIELFDGTQTVACASMVAASGGIWTADHKLLGLAYGYLKFTYTEGAFPAGMPSVKATIRGKRIYDQRTGLTVWSDNAALCIQDYMLMPAELGGMGCDASEISSATFTAGANISDQLVASDDAGGTEKRYTINGIIGLEGKPSGFVGSMLSACSGSAVYSGAEWRLHVGAPSSSVATIDESWLNGGMTFTVGSNKGELVNTVKGIFTDPTAFWADTEFPVVSSSAYVAEDEEELTADISLPFTTSSATAQRLARIVMEKSRQGFSISMGCNMQAFPLDALDVISLNNSQLGFDEAQFEISHWDFATMGGVNLALKKYDPAVYDWAGSDIVTAVTTEPLVLPDPWTVGAPTGLAVVDAPVEYEGSLSRSQTTFSWVSPSALATRYIVQLDGVDYALSVTTQYVFSDLIPGMYTFGVIALNASDVRSPVATIEYEVTTPSGTGAILLAGFAGGQTAYGGTEAGENLTLGSTAHETKGKILFGTSAYDESSNQLGLGTDTPTAVIHLPAGTAASGTAPAKMTAGTLMDTPEAGAIEWDGNKLYATSGSTRETVAYDSDALGYLLLAGRAGGQTAYGGTAAGENLTLGSTSDATKGKILFGTSAYDEVNQRLGLGVDAPTATVHLKAGAATASSAPVKLAAGTLMTTPEAGAIEWDANRLYVTAGSTRQTIAYALDVQNADAKVTPADADVVGLADSTASGLIRKLSWANIKITLKNYFDLLYPPIISPTFVTQVISPKFVTTSTGATSYNPNGYNGASAGHQLSATNGTGAMAVTRYTAGGSNECIFGVVQEAAGAGAFVWQGYSGAAYYERMRLSSAGVLFLNTTDNGSGAVLQIGGRFTASDSIVAGAGFGCNGKTAQVAVTAPADATDLASAIDLINNIKATLIANGISA